MPIESTTKSSNFLTRLTSKFFSSDWQQFWKLSLNCVDFISEVMFSIWFSSWVFPLRFTLLCTGSRLNSILSFKFWIQSEISFAAGIVETKKKIKLEQRAVIQNNLLILNYEFLVLCQTKMEFLILQSKNILTLSLECQIGPAKAKIPFKKTFQFFHGLLDYKNIYIDAKRQTWKW